MFKKTIKTFVGLFVACALLLGAIAPAYAENDNSNSKGNNGDNRGKPEREVKEFREAKEVGSSLEVHITDNGKVLVRGAKVTSVSGNTITAVSSWDSASISWNIVTDSATEFLRRFGGKSSIAEISAGDLISFQGMLQTSSASPLTVEAKIVKDWSVQKQNAAFSGTVASVDAGAQTFVLATEKRGNVVVAVASSTKIWKGDIIAAFSDIVAGIKLTATGLFNNLTSRLDADKIQIRVEKPQPIVLEGKIKTPPASDSAPTTFVATFKDKDYTVNVATDTSVLNVFWLRTPLSSLEAGHNVRVYGVVNSASSTIDATVVRDTSVR